jgi:uncharacterized protein (TIGR00369 family)
MLEQIIQELKTLLPEQLDEVHQAIKAYQLSLRNGKEGGLHFLGRFLGINWDVDGKAYMNLGTQNANTYGVAQGGALYTFADIAIGYDILKKLQKDQQVYTLELKMNFIKKGTGDRLYARTEFLHFGKTTVVAQCQILDNIGEIVAHALGTFYIVQI